MRITQHKANYLKAFFILVALVLLIGAGFIYSNSQRHQAQAVANHTETLNEIQKAVTELKASNQADHAQTVKYINCVLVGITNSASQSQALAVYQNCLSLSGATQ